jgi:hypothetical protein
MSAAARAPEAEAEGFERKFGGDRPDRPGFKRIPKPDQAKFDGQVALKEAEISRLEAQVADIERKAASKIESTKGVRVRQGVAALGLGGRGRSGRGGWVTLPQWGVVCAHKPHFLLGRRSLPP